MGRGFVGYVPVVEVIKTENVLRQATFRRPPHSVNVPVSFDAAQYFLVV